MSVRNYESSTIPVIAIDGPSASGKGTVAALVALAGVPVRINDPKCVNKTFPTYFEKFAGIGQGAGLACKS